MEPMTYKLSLNKSAGCLLEATGKAVTKNGFCDHKRSVGSKYFEDVSFFPVPGV